MYINQKFNPKPKRIEMFRVQSCHLFHFYLRVYQRLLARSFAPFLAVVTGLRHYYRGIERRGLCVEATNDTSRHY